MIRTFVDDSQALSNSPNESSNDSPPDKPSHDEMSSALTTLPTSSNSPGPQNRPAADDDSSSDSSSSDNPRDKTVTPESLISSSKALKQSVASVEDHLGGTPSAANSSNQESLATSKPNSKPFREVCTADAEPAATPPYRVNSYGHIEE